MGDREQRRAVIAGGILGALCGVSLALLWRRWRRHRGTRVRKPVQAGQVIRLVNASATVLRQLLDLLG